MIELIQQPKGSALCGHCCVAMLAQVSLHHVIAVVGHKHGTTTRELTRALSYFGYACGKRLTSAPRTLRQRLTKLDRALLKLSFDQDRNWHWLAWIDGGIYEPNAGKVFRTFEYFSLVYGRPTSYLAVRKDFDHCLRFMDQKQCRR